MERRRLMMRPPGPEFGMRGAANIRLFSTDLDGTLLGHPEGAARFAGQWASLAPHRRPLLAYNTGRTVVDTRALIAARHLPQPEFIIGSVGTELYDSLYNRGDEFRRQFRTGWNLEAVEQIIAATPGVRRQPPECLHPLKSSWYWVRARREDVAELEQRLQAAGIAAAVIYSCRYFLDVVPKNAGKGPALAWLCQRLAIPLAHVLVAGDTANDSSMFLLPQVRGIVVENALPELLSATLDRRIFVARQPMADGVLEGLTHYGVIAEPAHRDRPAALA